MIIQIDLNSIKDFDSWESLESCLRQLGLKEELDMAKKCKEAWLESLGDVW